MAPFETNKGTERIREEAAIWVIRLEDEQIPDTEINAFREWFARSKAHRKLFKEISALSREFDHLGVLTEQTSLSLPANLQQIRVSTKDRYSPRRKLSAIRLAASAAVIMMAVMIGFILFYPGEQVFIAEKGERPLIELPDGSTAHLNSNSRITVDYSRGERRIKLAYGEATFTVSKDQNRPFKVDAGAGSATALGTEFNVKNRSTNVTVTVFSGTVLVAHSPMQDIKRPTDVSADSIGRLLESGQQVHYHQRLGEVHTLPTEQLARTASWRDGRLFFNNETLENVIHEISHYTAKKLIIADGSLQSLRVGGVFKVDDIDSVINILETALPVKAVSVSPELTMLIEKKTPP